MGPAAGCLGEARARTRGQQIGLREQWTHLCPSSRSRGWVCHGQLRAQKGGGSLAPWQTPQWRQMLPGTRTGDPRPRPSVSSGNTADITVSLSRRAFQANTSLASTRPEMRHRMGSEQCLCPSHSSLHLAPAKIPLSPWASGNPPAHTANEGHLDVPLVPCLSKFPSSALPSQNLGVYLDRSLCCPHPALCAGCLKNTAISLSLSAQAHHLA